MPTHTHVDICRAFPCRAAEGGGAAAVVEAGEIGGQGRVVESPPAELGVEPPEGAGVGAAGVGAERRRRRGAGRCRRVASGPAAAGGARASSTPVRAVPGAVIRSL